MDESQATDEVDTITNPDSAQDVDEALVELLAAGRTHTEAGATVGRSAKFVQRRLRSGDLQRRVVQRRAERLDEVVGRLGNSVHLAVDVMVAELEADRPADRLRAAGLLIASLVKVRDQAHIDNTIAELRSELDAVQARLEGS